MTKTSGASKHCPWSINELHLNESIVLVTKNDIFEFYFFHFTKNWPLVFNSNKLSIISSNSTANWNASLTSCDSVSSCGFETSKLPGILVYWKTFISLSTFSKITYTMMKLQSFNQSLTITEICTSITRSSQMLPKISKLNNPVFEFIWILWDVSVSITYKLMQ